MLSFSYKNALWNLFKDSDVATVIYGLIWIGGGVGGGQSDIRKYPWVHFQKQYAEIQCHWKKIDILLKYIK